MAETIMEKYHWLLEHPEEEAKYTGEFIAVAGRKVVAHGKVFAEVYDEARRQGYEPLMAYAYGEEVYVL
jgi:hypothetical protein